MNYKKLILPLIITFMAIVVNVIMVNYYTNWITITTTSIVCVASVGVVASFVYHLKKHIKTRRKISDK